MKPLMMVTCEIKHWNYFTYNHVWNHFRIISATEIISKLFQRHWTCWKIFV